MTCMGCIQIPFGCLYLPLQTIVAKSTAESAGPSVWREHVLVARNALDKHTL